MKQRGAGRAGLIRRRHNQSGGRAWDPPKGPPPRGPPLSLISSLRRRSSSRRRAHSFSPDCHGASRKASACAPRASQGLTKKLFWKHPYLPFLWACTHRRAGADASAGAPPAIWQTVMRRCLSASGQGSAPRSADCRPLAPASEQGPIPNYFMRRFIRLTRRHRWEPPPGAGQRRWEQAGTALCRAQAVRPGHVRARRGRPRTCRSACECSWRKTCRPLSRLASRPTPPPPMMTQTRSRGGASSGAASALGASSGYSGSSACAPGSGPASLPNLLAIRCSRQPVQAGRGRSLSRPGGALPAAPCGLQAPGAGRWRAGGGLRGAGGGQRGAPGAAPETPPACRARPGSAPRSRRGRRGTRPRQRPPVRPSRPPGSR